MFGSNFTKKWFDKMFVNSYFSSLLTNRSNTILTPTLMDDTTATKLGLKEYEITVTGTNWITGKAIAIPYQMQDGTWRMKFNITGNQSPKSGVVNLTFVGVVFSANTLTSGNFYQCISAYYGDEPVEIARTQPNQSDILIRSYQATVGAGTYIAASGDVILESKPDWAI